MSYTKAFRRLHTRSRGVATNSVQYKRVAIYIGRVFMAETAKEPTGRVDLNSPITSRLQWVDEVRGHKESMISDFLELNEYEWDLIMKAMIHYANESHGSELWIKKRLGWICELDTLRAFHAD